jgi:peptide/nickel transport system permease protein
LQPPSSAHIFGTDKIGRDVFSRILYGGRISITVGLGSALIATVIGVSLGTVAGYKGGKFDGIVMKISEILMAFPQMILVLILVTITGQSLWNLIFIFSMTGWPSMYRMARSQMLSIREEEYVQALKAFGISSFRIAFVHMLPNAIGPIFVNITLSTAMFILQETSLSFLGLGVPLEVSTWGNILNAAQDILILRDAWWVWLPTGIIVTLFVISINFIGDGLRDATDPSQIG